MSDTLLKVLVPNDLMQPRDKKPNAFRAKYHWASLQIGEGYVLPPGTAKLVTLKSLAYKAGKKLKRDFGVSDGGERGILIFRRADPVEEIK